MLYIESIEAFARVQEVQIVTFLKFSYKTIVLLINFNALLFKKGVKRY
ncbi:MAG: GxxExxY protein [Deltaproteobacteria bacterium]